MTKAQIHQNPLIFQRLGGDLQLKIAAFADLPGVLALDEAFWAINSIDVSSLRLNRTFLDFLDSDHNGKIRSDEIRQAITFVQEAVADGDFSRLEHQLRLNDLNASTPTGQNIHEAARQILQNCNRDTDTPLTLELLNQDQVFKKCAFGNGDGVIVPAPERPLKFNERLLLIMEFAGKQLDLSGAAGVNLDQVKKFQETARQVLTWRLADHHETYAAYFTPDQATQLAKQAQPLLEVVDRYFIAVAAQKFLADDPARFAPKNLVADLNAPQEVANLLQQSILAPLQPDGQLNLAGELNPLWAEQLRKLFALPGAEQFCSAHRLDYAHWQTFKQALQPYWEWQKKRPLGAEFFDRYTTSELQNLADDPINQELEASCEADLQAGAALSGVDNLRKLLLYQDNLLTLLNNFVSLNDLFALAGDSPLQAGTLILDGRHYTLTMPVKNLAEHRKIVEQSDICVLYVELSTARNDRELPFKVLAVAVTAGSIRDLFIGKPGIFHTADGEWFDAKIIAMVEQPVSVAEALKEPFRRFGLFLGGQVDKLLLSRSQTAQKNLSNQLSKGQLLPPPAAPAASPMWLMSGSIGLAALGSSVAFIVKSLEKVYWGDIVSILAGIILIFGGPVVLLSLVKLFRRNLSRFFEASGCAVNRKLRLSHRMGAVFTFIPERPRAQYQSSWLKRRPPIRQKMGLVVLLALLVAALGWGIYVKFVCPETVQAITITNKK